MVYWKVFLRQQHGVLSEELSGGVFTQADGPIQCFFFHVEIFRASIVWNFHEGNLIKLTLQLWYHMTTSETTVVATLCLNDSDLK